MHVIGVKKNAEDLNRDERLVDMTESDRVTEGKSILFIVYELKFLIDIKLHM